VATIRVLLVDDNGEMLTDLRDELSAEFEIAGTADSGEEAIREVLRLDPDVIVLDITMPVMNGLQVASSLRDMHRRTKILFLTIHVTKRRLASDLALAIREVSVGRNFLSPSLHK